MTNKFVKTPKLIKFSIILELWTTRLLAESMNNCKQHALNYLEPLMAKMRKTAELLESVSLFFRVICLSANLAFFKLLGLVLALSSMKTSLTAW